MAANKNFTHIFLTHFNLRFRNRAGILSLPGIVRNNRRRYKLEIGVDIFYNGES